MYRRNNFTWLAFAGLLTIGFFQAALGPALPYIRSIEHISYLPAALLQAAFAVGGGTAGLLTRARLPASRTLVLRVGLAGIAVAGIGLAYVNAFVLTAAAAFVMSLLGTSATIRFWAALADAHKSARTVAMTEGEVSVSTGGILAPLAISGAAATALGWRLGFVLGAVAAAAVLVGSAIMAIPAEQRPRQDEPQNRGSADRGGLPPALVVVVAVVALEWSGSFWLATYLSADVHLRLGVAVAMVSVLYAAILASRLIVSRLARQMTARWLLLICLAVAFTGLVPLLVASDAALTAAAVAITGLGIGGTFPLTSSLHVETSGATSTAAVGQVMTAAAIGQLGGPLAVGAIAEYASLRVGLVLLPVLTLLAMAGLGRHVHAHRESATCPTSR